MILHINKANGFPLQILTKLNTGMFHQKTSPNIPVTHNTTEQKLVTFTLQACNTNIDTSLS